MEKMSTLNNAKCKGEMEYIAMEKKQTLPQCKSREGNWHLLLIEKRSLCGMPVKKRVCRNG